MFAGITCSPALSITANKDDLKVFSCLFTVMSLPIIMSVQGLHFHSQSILFIHMDVEKANRWLLMNFAECMNALEQFHYLLQEEFIITVIKRLE